MGEQIGNARRCAIFPLFMRFFALARSTALFLSPQ
jgi:hypothetical protein